MLKTVLKTMFKTMFKTMLKNLMLVTSLLAVAPLQAAVILQYHHIGADTPAITSTSIEAFEQHLEYLAGSGLEIVSLSEIVAHPERQTPQRVAITFDDAYDNIYLNAVPRLKARGWPFTIFVSTEYIDRKGFISWDQLRKIEAADGLIANHSHSHMHMLRKRTGETKPAWLKRLRKDIEKAQRLLDKNLANPRPYFAYPYGEFDPDILKLIEDMGFTGFGQQSGAVGPLSLLTALPRFPLSGAYEDLETFITKVHTRALPINVKPVSPLITTNPPTLVLEFPEPANLPLDLLACYGPGGKTTLINVAPGVFEATNQTRLPIGRSRYNCTMPAGNAGDFYWFSQLWIQKNPDGSWYPEP
ncbi:MAG: biofilm PGA synthesis lipoprotein PgaB [Candidatus Azotimanducaceae bacterium]